MQDRVWRSGVFAWLGVSLLFSLPVAAADLFVNNRVGNDAFSGASPVLDSAGNGPVRTLRGAWERVRPGDRIVLLPTDSPYHDEIVFSGVRVQGYPNFPIILEGNGVELVGTEAIPPEDWRYFRRGAYVLEGPFQGQRPLMLGGQPAERVDASPWGNLPDLSPGQYVYWRGTTVFQADPSKGILDYPLERSNLRFGLLLERVSHLTVRNLRVRGFSQDGIQIRGPAKGVTFERCLIADNGRAGVSLYNNADVRFMGCFVEGNGRAGVLNDNFSQLQLEGCSVQSTPTAVATDGTSRVRIKGGTPEPLESGPFVFPAPRPGRTQTIVPSDKREPNKERPGFFDPN